MNQRDINNLQEIRKSLIKLKQEPEGIRHDETRYVEISVCLLRLESVLRNNGIKKPALEELPEPA